MMEQIFINEFLTIGFEAFFKKSKDDVFERHIIECLVDIYGEKALKEIYDTKNEAAFIALIYKYGLAPKVYDNFLRDSNSYERFKKEYSTDPSKKTDIASAVESSIITMFLYKCLIEEATFEELSHFENDLLNDFSVIKLHFNMSLNPNKTRKLWEKKKKMLRDNVELVEIKPTYLDEFTYARYGVNIKDVKSMDPRMVTELNRYIMTKVNEHKDEAPKKKVPLTANTVLTSGNGFVDALIIVSIIVTELSIGLIYLFLHI